VGAAVRKDATPSVERESPAQPYHELRARDYQELLWMVGKNNVAGSVLKRRGIAP
jgi:hypothetical protein